MTKHSDISVTEAARILTDACKNPDALKTAEECTTVLSALAVLYKAGKALSLAPLLPLLLRLKGKPYSLKNYFMMLPMFRLTQPRSIIWRTGRQVSKSTTLAAQGCVQSATIPYLSTLFVLPRFEQSRRLSNNYVKPFLTNTPLSEISIDKGAEQSVLQRSFLNGSMMHFSYAFLDADRIRGISVDKLAIDEIQDMDIDLLPVITETLSASEYNLRQYTGTPKTMDNTIEELWEKSSMAEWIIPCSHCGHWSVAALEYDLIKMIQKHGLSCGKCGKLIDSAKGHWEHRHPDLRAKFAGYHVPQPILPMHYMPNAATGVKEKWMELWDSLHSMDQASFYNEKLGEACDIRVNLLSRRDLIGASVLAHDNDFKKAINESHFHPVRTMGVDWGGGGESGVSYTAIAIVGHHPNGKSDVIYAEKLVNIGGHVEEARRVLHLFSAFRCSVLAHDFAGSGSVRETILIQMGFDPKQLMPMCYMGSLGRNVVTYHPPQGASTRAYYNVHKARSLVLLCQCIKYGVIRFPQYETWQEHASDFLALVEDKRQRDFGADVYVVTRKAGSSDDVAHAVNFATLAHWHANGAYPNLSNHISVQ